MALEHVDAEIWDRLLRDIAPVLVRDKKYCAVQGIQGSRFQEGKGIVIIGRAPNAWPIEFCEAQVEDRAQRWGLINRILSVNVCELDREGFDRATCGPMHWLKHPRHSGSNQRTTTEIKIHRFWSAVEDCLRDFAPDWEETIAWTNLYAVSRESGNPNPRLASAELVASAELLKSALNRWRPRVALFITEVNSPTNRSFSWSEPFLDRLPISDIQCRPEGPIVATARLHENAHAVFLVRPDKRRGPRPDFKGPLTPLLQ